LHPALGLFWQSPVLIMSLAGIWFMVREPAYRVEALIAITAFFALLILYSGFYNWWGGSTFGARYLIPILAFLGLPLAFIPKRWFSGLVILGIISILQMFIAVSSRIIVPDDFYKQIDTLGFFAYSSIYSYCFPLLLNGDFSTNLGNKLLGLSNWLSLIPLIVAVSVITVIFLQGRISLKILRQL
jgi:hypothetical protein